MHKTTAIGSLPFRHISEAIDFSLELDLPIVPELPLFNETMLVRNQELLIKMCEHASGKKLKNQIIGPGTFERFTKENSESYRLYLKKILKQHQELKSAYKIDFYLQIDEPVLMRSFEYSTLLHEISNHGLKPLLHSCQKVPEDFSFPDWSVPYLALDIDLNPNLASLPMLFIEGYDPRVGKPRSNTEWVSFTCGFGLMKREETYKIQELLK